MIKFITKLAKDAKEHLWLLESMAFSDVFNRLEETDQAYRIYILGETYLMLRHIEHSKSSLERIEKYCLSEINGTFYDDYEKQWEGTDIEPEYTAETPYKYILGIWEHLPNPDLGSDISEFIEKNCSIGTALTQGITKFFPTAGPYKQNSEGEIEKVSMLECQISDNMKAGSMLAALEDYNERLAKIREIAKNKGTLGEILKLIHSSR